MFRSLSSWRDVISFFDSILSARRRLRQRISTRLWRWWYGRSTSCCEALCRSCKLTDQYMSYNWDYLPFKKFYYSLKIYLRGWLALVLRPNLHNPLAMTKFGRCSQIIPSLTPVNQTIMIVYCQLSTSLELTISPMWLIWRANMAVWKIKSHEVPLDYSHTSIFEIV